MADQHNVIRKAMSEAVEAHRVRKGIGALVTRGVSAVRGAGRSAAVSLAERRATKDLMGRGLSRTEAETVAQSAFRLGDAQAQQRLRTMFGRDYDFGVTIGGMSLGARVNTRLGLPR